jgi:hypothetical protein
MTHTLSIDRVNDTAAAVDVPQLDQTDIGLVSVDRDTSKGSVEAVYTIPTGDSNYPTTIVVRHAVDPKDRNATARNLIAINSFARDYDDVTGEEIVKPISAVLTLQLPSIQLEAADIAVLVGNLYGLSFNTLTSQVPDTDVLSKLLFGQVEVF